MKSGKLTHVLTIQRASNGVNDAGTPTTTWADLATLRAERVEQSTTEFIRNYGAADETVAVFRTRFVAGVTNADRISFDGDAFNIKQVVILGRNRGYEFRCTRLE
jgi:SPP1 family predicted phage head-tail adaptor